VRRAPHRLLMMDYDGTLAPFRIEREEATPLPRSIELLHEVARHHATTVAIISGRPLEELERLVGPLPAELFGEHGAERRMPDGSVQRRPLSAHAAAALDDAARAATAEGWADLIERKRFSVVIHTRGLPRQEVQRIESRAVELWGRAEIDGEVTVGRFNGGVELRARGRDKGTAVMALAAQVPAGAFPVFVGDDVTDEDAFEVVRPWGYGIRVGGVERASHAVARLPSPDAVTAFLEDWLEATAPEPEPPRA